ncbi:MAG: ribonuclease E/G [Defluviitaleaceae bacterium]|nr:ribonuclease E/G [Defluviitaleaceae bacterium]
MKKVYVNCQPYGYLTAVAENGKLIEIIRDDDANASVVGNIYAGIVKKINTGFIFLDIGLVKQAFLDTRDHRERSLFHEGKLEVKQGDTLIVQVLRDGIGDKGCIATSSISYAGRYIVLSKSVEGDKINISKKIKENVELRRLHAIGEKHVPIGFSAIFRSEAEGQEEDKIILEIPKVAEKFVHHAEWQHVKAPAVLFEEPPIIKTLREIVTDDIDEIMVDDAATCELLGQYGSKLKYYDGAESIFSKSFLKTQIDKVREKRVWLKSGAFIVIEQTEACVVIDVNSGKQVVTKRDDASLKVNMEAAKEIAYQLRLRNLSGIIIIDFIAMKSPDDVASLTELLRKEMIKDRIPNVVVGMTTLGLMEVTRKRMRSPF